MLKELSKYVVIGLIAGLIAYFFISSQTVITTVVNNEAEDHISTGSYNSIYENVKNSVVTIQTNRGRGSGVIVTDSGHVVTNEHVIRGAKQVSIITDDNQIFSAKLVGIDTITDLALLSTSFRGKPIKFADSTKVSVGDIVLAIGNPFGVGQTLTQGIVSRTNSGHITENPLDEFIQSDAAINPGNSGGAMIDIYGNLIGINTMNISLGGGSDGIGLSVPSNLVKSIIEQIIKYGRAVRGYIGMSAYDSSKGVVVTAVLKNGPADAAGLMPNDVIIKIDEMKINDIKQVVKIVASLKVDEQIIIKFKRENKIISAKVKVAAMPSSHKTIVR